MQVQTKPWILQVVFSYTWTHPKTRGLTKKPIDSYLYIRRLTSLICIILKLRISQPISRFGVGSITRQRKGPMKGQLTSSYMSKTRNMYTFQFLIIILSNSTPFSWNDYLLNTYACWLKPEWVNEAIHSTEWGPWEVNVSSLCQNPDVCIHFLLTIFILE